jgi:hypothetical protein
MGFVGAEGVNRKHQKVVGVNAQHQVGKDGDVFGDGFFVVGFKVGEGGQRSPLDRPTLVEQAALPDVGIAYVKAKVVFHAGAAVEGRVHPAEVVAFGEVFHRQLPVGVAGEGNLAGLAAQQAEVVGRPAIAHGCRYSSSGGASPDRLTNTRSSHCSQRMGDSPLLCDRSPRRNLCSSHQSGACS